MISRFRTFLAGFLVLLPLAVTITVIVWVGTFIYAYVGPDSAIGRILISIGFGLSDSPIAAYALGAVIVVGLIYLLGLGVESRLESRVRHLINSLMQRIPFVGNLYDVTKRFVAIMDRRDQDGLKSMSPVWCFFGGDGGAGVLGLLPMPKPIMIGGERYHVVLVPSAPVPVGGALDLCPGRLGQAGQYRRRNPDEHLRIDGRGLAANRGERTGARPTPSAGPNSRGAFVGSIRPAVVMHEGPFAVRGERSPEVVIRIDHRISGIAVADLQINDVAAATINQVVGVTGTRFESGAHPGPELRLAHIGHQHGFALDDIDELVFAAMAMTQRRHAARRQPRQVHAEIGQAELVPERPPLPSGDTRGVGLGVTSTGAGGGHGAGLDCRRLCCLRHPVLPASVSKRLCSVSTGLTIRRRTLTIVVYPSVAR